MSPSDDPHLLVIRRVIVRGRHTSLRIESIFWTMLEAIAKAEGMTVNDVLSELDARRGPLNLTAAVRVLTVTYFKDGPSADRQPVEGADGA